MDEIVRLQMQEQASSKSIILTIEIIFTMVTNECVTFYLSLGNRGIDGVGVVVRMVILSF